MSCTRFFHQSFIDTDLVSSSFVSSQQAAFPVSNIYNQQRRSKVWRSQGFWEVLSGANTIVFQETTGVDLTATIPAGEYTSSTSFFAALKTAFEAVGASTYTVVSDTSTKKVKVTCNGVGGGGIFQLRWSHAASASIAAILGYDTSTDDTGALAYLSDVLKIHTSEWLMWDLGLSGNPRALALIGPRNTPLKISPSAIIRILGNETNNWTAPSYEQTLTYNDAILQQMKEAGFHTESLRYWRLQIIDASNPLGFVEFGSVYLGEYYSPTRGSPQFPFQSEYIDRSTTVFSEGGQTFSDILPKSERFSLEWFGLTVTEKEEIDEIFTKFGVSIPMFMSFDSEANFSSSVNYFVRYVKFDKEPVVSLTSPNNYTMRMEFREEL